MTTAIVAIGADALEELIGRAVAKGIIEASRKTASKVERVSAAEAAVMVEKRRGKVYAACESGSLKAERSGNRWSIKVEDLDAWVIAGCKP